MILLDIFRYIQFKLNGDTDLNVMESTPEEDILKKTFLRYREK